jgi:hypothetical protein
VTGAVNSRFCSGDPMILDALRTPNALLAVAELENIFSEDLLPSQASSTANFVCRSCRTVDSLEDEEKLPCYYYYEQGALRGIFSEDSEAMHIHNETVIHLNPVDHLLLSNNANLKSKHPVYPIDVQQ